VFTCVVDKNGTNNDVMWEQIRVGGDTTTLGSFNIATTIGEDILTSTLTITGVTNISNLGTSLYRCVVNDVMSRNAAINVLTGNDSLNMYVIIHYCFSKWNRDH